MAALSWVARSLRNQNAVQLRMYSAPAAAPVEPLLKKVLIANRGEIACRIINTAKSMGVKTVSVFSDADANAQHVKLADESFNIGPPPSSESYLQMDKILEVAKQTGAEGIHPGYGFLSENENFSRMCAAEGIEFIGPPAKAIEDMGIKSTSKKIMIDAEVPVIAGYHGDEQSDDHLAAEAEKMGYPVLIKAVKGGGGRGMRIVDTPEEFQGKLDQARNEARQHFSDDVVLIEQYIQRPRHVEVQVFADTHGNCVYLYERDCSVQRRHQKVIEESPAPGLTPEMRQSIGEAAVRAAKAVNYVGAGTVEFILDTKTNKFYFMEMNTRLQVEHPVTEYVTGTDLVKWQLMVASGHKLPLKQEDIPLLGHSFEARIYAEDPEAGFLPGAGGLPFVQLPKLGKNVRVDTGFNEGDEVTAYYDAMISKLVVWGENRDIALRRLIAALTDYNIAGLATNIDFVKSVAQHPSFVEGDVSTDFIDDFYDDLFPAKTYPDHIIYQAALALVIDNQFDADMEEVQEFNSPWTAHANGITIGKAPHHLKLVVGEDEVTVTWKLISGNDTFSMSINGAEPVTVRGEWTDDKLEAHVEDRFYNNTIAILDDTVDVFSQDKLYKLSVGKPKFLKQSAGAGGNAVAAKMQGQIEKVFVKVGDEVKFKQPLVAMQAMKMEQVLESPRDGIVSRVNVQEDDNVAGGTVLVQLEPLEEE